MWIFFFLNSLTSSSRASCFCSSFCLATSAFLIYGLDYHYNYSFFASNFIFYYFKVLLLTTSCLQSQFCSVSLLIFPFITSRTEAGTRLSYFFLYLSTFYTFSLTYFSRAALRTRSCNNYSGTFSQNLGFFFCPSLISFSREFFSASSFFVFSFN